MKYVNNHNISLADYVDVLKSEEHQKFEAINHFLDSLPVAPASKRLNFSFFKSYIRVVHGVKIDNDDRKDFIKFESIPDIPRFPLTREIIQRMCENSNDIQEVFYLIQSSSGMRISESLQLRKEDFDFTESPVKITIPARFTKGKKERVTFISHEAVSKLNKIKVEYFEEKTYNNFEQYFYQLRKRLNLIEKYEKSINYKINIHSFRAYFRTCSARAKIAQEVSESLIGHKGYLKQYVRLEDKFLQSEYRKLEPHLKIFTAPNV
jgi:integrase